MVLTNFDSTICLSYLKVLDNVAIIVVSEEKGNRDMETLKGDFINFQREIQEQYLRGMV